jgi:hypothetical protein
MNEELTTLERWDLLRKYYTENPGQVQWDRMAIPPHEWFNQYHIKTPTHKHELTNEEMEHLKLVAWYREEDKKLRQQKEIK